MHCSSVYLRHTFVYMDTFSSAIKGNLDVISYEDIIISGHVKKKNCPDRVLQSLCN